MGAELECSLNLSTTLAINNHEEPIGFNTLDSEIKFDKILLKVGIWSGSNQFQESMDQYIGHQREYVRETMMKQEQIFKQQVCELHRLYKVQKRQMAKLGSKESKLYSDSAPGEMRFAKNKFWRSASTSETSYSSHNNIRYKSADQLSSENSFLQLDNTKAAPSSRELSICSGDPSSKHKQFDLELPPIDDDDDDDGAMVTKSETAMLCKHLKGKTGIEGPELRSDKENDIDLTLSIGHGAHTNNWTP